MNKTKKEKKVRVTLELSTSFLRLLGAKAVFRGWTSCLLDDTSELDVGDVVAWLVYLEGRGAPDAEICAVTPLMWRNAGVELVHEERRVIEG